MEVWCAPHWIWQAWTSSRRSKRQDRGSLRKLWKAMTPMDGSSQHSRARWPGSVRMRGEQFLIQSVSPLGMRRSSQIVAKDGHAAVGKCGGNVGNEKKGYLFRFGKAKGTPDMQFCVGRQLLDHVPFQKSPRTNAAGSDSGSRDAGVGPKNRRVCGGQVLVNVKRSLIFQFVPSRDVTDFFFFLKRNSRSLDVL